MFQILNKYVELKIQVLKSVYKKIYFISYKILGRVSQILTKTCLNWLKVWTISTLHPLDGAKLTKEVGKELLVTMCTVVCAPRLHSLQFREKRLTTKVTETKHLRYNRLQTVKTIQIYACTIIIIFNGMGVTHSHLFLVLPNTMWMNQSFVLVNKYSAWKKWHTLSSGE